MLIFSPHFPHQSLKAPELKEKLHESEKLILEMTVTWEEKLRKTEEIATVCTSLIMRLQNYNSISYLYVKLHRYYLCLGASKAAGEHGHLSGNIRD